MRLDVITIFPEYLDPLRHALLGKAIEQGILSVGVHDLRDWAPGVHQAVDDSPYGGGPGMVMTPTVWGPALDAVAAGSAPGAELSSSQQHRGGPRHDELAGVDACAYEPDQEDRSLPLLLVPTPAGTPFTQEDARRWSTESHIVFACGRYEGIDQRVFEDAATHYRVREVSIGDYVLIGGEVAVLVIAEAVVRLIPGVLGNRRSHEEDSFSDGLLEGPSYTKPRTWRGLSVPEALTSGDHARIRRWHRQQAIVRTARVRPELLDAAELTAAERQALAARRRHVTNLTVLLDPRQWRDHLPHARAALSSAGLDVERMDAYAQASTCQPDNMLANEYEATHGFSPVGMELYRLEVVATSELECDAVTAAVVGALPDNTPWYGSTRWQDQ